MDSFRFRCHLSSGQVGTLLPWAIADEHPYGTRANRSGGPIDGVLRREVDPDVLIAEWQVCGTAPHTSRVYAYTCGERLCVATLASEVRPG